MNAYVNTIDWLYKERLKVDDEWSERMPTGFRWWGYQHAQTIEIVREDIGPDGATGYLISVRTELLRALELGPIESTIINIGLMPFASMAGPVYDDKAKTLSLCSLAYVNQLNENWLRELISVASVLQIGEARIIGPYFAELLHVEEALSGPPNRGFRPQPDELAEMIPDFIVPSGQLPVLWTEPEFQDAVDRFMNRPPAILASAGGPGLTVEFPCGDQSSLCQINTFEQHPHFGNGLLILQSFPYINLPDLDGVGLALSLNQLELTQKPFGYGFGSYVYRDGMLHFTCFLPNGFYRPGLLPNIYFSCAQRAREISVRIFGRDWTQSSFSPQYSAYGRIMAGLGIVDDN